MILEKEENCKAIVLDRHEKWVFIFVFVFFWGEVVCLFVLDSGIGNSESILVQDETASLHQKVVELPLGGLLGCNQGEF